MSSGSSRWRILSILILVVIVVASLGSYLISNRPVGQSTTGLPSSAVVSGTGTQTATTSMTAVSWPSIQWIAVGKVRPMNYYLTLLESNGTQPYLRLGQELRRLPDLSNATAVAEITYLALNATNPEVKEGFELMMKGGTPDPRDFSYSVPSYNTELHVLYWLALQNEFKRDDTLALAIAMVNGLWVAMGDEHVGAAVYNDTNYLLRFFRETNEIQRIRGHPSLEDYPLEAKIPLAWTENQVAFRGQYALLDYLAKKLDLSAYKHESRHIRENAKGR